MKVRTVGVSIGALFGVFVLGAALAQTPKRVERADELPRFTYPVQGEVEALVRDPQRFAALAADVRRNTESTLAAYDIAETPHAASCWAR